MRWKEFSKRYLRVHKCGGCREILSYEAFEEALCPTCRSRWNTAKIESCPVCSQSALECICMPKGLSRAGALCLRKLLFYVPAREKEPQNRLIYFLKQNPNRRMNRFLAQELMPALRQETAVLGLTEESLILIGVPRSRSSRAVYGFDQAVLLARALSEDLGIPTAEPIKRLWGGKKQKKLRREARFRNLEGRFLMTDPDAVKGKCVLLLDDVVTTGASMAGCVSLLKKAGASSVICFCIAQSVKIDRK